MASSLVCRETQCRVSSVLNRDVKQFGKKFMFDSNEETCWNSDQGECQWVALDFPHPVRVSRLNVQFQGGFSAKACRLEGSLRGEDTKEIHQFYPEDNNSLQSFPIQEAPSVDKVKIMFENSADFFGRIIVYSLDLLGEKAL
ncbi:nuclear receptor 2C2-associated protein [Synchiropus splendidus]|uniref:nuclear receptor 2C2-associated protein n=1 Tax=Synchiropus splendidus TaxID=270530 RepID=UPI00237E9541|nr:nuclear receptor 2C2-associated protein [Synchiropus splendidus]